MLTFLAKLGIRPSLPVFGPGPLTNLKCFPHWSDRECDAAWTNAAAHLGWALAIPLLGEHLGGRTWLWIAGGAWLVFTVVYESLFHAPETPGPAYASEVRTDLLTRIVPCAALLLVAALSH